jgi:hypothetical protein
MKIILLENRMKKTLFFLFVLGLLPFPVAHAQYFHWAGAMGGWSMDYGYGIAVDDSGNTYVTGSFTSDNAEFDPGPGIHYVQGYNSNDIFIEKLDPQGEMVWIKVIADWAHESGEDMVIDAQGNLYIVGYFGWTAVDFDPGPGIFYMSAEGESDVFVLKMDRNGNLVWARSMGGEGEDIGRAIALDPAGNIVLTGYFTETMDFDPGSGTYNLTAVDHEDVFVAKLDTSGNFLWAAKMGGEDRGGF